MGRALFITGGGSGLGAAVARLAAGAGWRVGVAGRRIEPLRALAAELPNTRAVPLDVTDAAAVARAIADFDPDALVCCAAVLGRGDVFDDLTPARFADVHAVNVGGTYNACAAAMRHWHERQRTGDIVNVASLGGIRGLQKFPGFAAYASSKHAIVGLTEALALEGKAHGIRVNAVAPGTMRTPMAAELGLTPSTTPEAIAPTVAFLLDRERSGPVSGSTVEVHCNDD
ncbi:MAG TPA: SDR family oxidoreductase [Nevskiaceae bacterium]|nr:SDR family oxidoreductase [Nevskiaceae bacterium]